MVMQQQKTALDVRRSSVSFNSRNNK